MLKVTSLQQSCLKDCHISWRVIGRSWGRALCWVVCETQVDQCMAQVGQPDRCMCLKKGFLVSCLRDLNAVVASELATGSACQLPVYDGCHLGSQTPVPFLALLPAPGPENPVTEARLKGLQLDHQNPVQAAVNGVAQPTTTISSSSCTVSPEHLAFVCNMILASKTRPAWGTETCSMQAQ